MPSSRRIASLQAGSQVSACFSPDIPQGLPFVSVLYNDPKIWVLEEKFTGRGMVLGEENESGGDNRPGEGNTDRGNPESILLSA